MEQFTLSESERQLLKAELFRQLTDDHAFWSYDPASVTLENASDEIIVYKTLRHLDVDAISLLIFVYGIPKIREVWEQTLAIEGQYMHRLNKFLAYAYFGIKNPEQHIQELCRQHVAGLKTAGAKLT